MIVNVVCNDSSFAFPNVFRPEGNINNRFRPLGILKSNPFIRKFTVFNRWGQKVYEVTDTPALEIKGCDGTSNGKLEDPNTFVWIVEVDCPSGRSFRKGFVILSR